MYKGLVIVTGASSGIGAAVASKLSAAGYSLALLARHRGEMAAWDLPATQIYQVDVTDANAVNAMRLDAEARFGSCVGLINSAGVIKPGPFHEVSHADHAAIININVMGVINTCLSVLPGMRARRNGTIINVTSVADRKARPTIASYAASKAAVKSLTESLRTDNAPYGVRVLQIAPGPVATSMMVGSDLPDNHIVSPEEMADMIVWMLQQPAHLCIRDVVIAATGYAS